jgi:hypothetical protein
MKDRSIPFPTIESIAKYARKNASKLKKETHGAHKVSESVRETDYKGHHIKIRTTYRIEVDGKPVTAHIGVTQDGRVHYHPIPNASYASAIDMVKRLIDFFPSGVGTAPNGHHHHMRKQRKPRATRPAKSHSAKARRHNRRS